MTSRPVDRRTLFRLAALVLVPGGAATCSSLIPGSGAPPQLYVLMRKTTFPPDLPTVSRQLLVDTPVAPAEIDTTRVALTRSPTTIDYFANARRFEARYESGESPPTVLVRLLVRLVRMPERTIIGEEIAEGRETAQANAMDAIVEAYNEALGSVMKRLVTWTLRTMSQDSGVR